MKNYDWKTLRVKRHATVNGFPDESLLEKAIGASVYRVTYHLCNGVPSGSARFSTRRDAETALVET